MKQIIEFPFSLDSKVVTVCCVGPTFTDVRVEEGVVEELSCTRRNLNIYTSAHIRLAGGCTTTWTDDKNFFTDEVYSEDVDAVVEKITRMGYKVREVRRFENHS